MGWFTALMGIPPVMPAPEEPSPHFPQRDLQQVIDAVIADQSAPASIRTLPAVTGARRLIASTIDQLDMVVQEGASRLPAPRWLRDPRRYGSQLDTGDLVEHAIDSMILHGRAYLLATPVSDLPSWRLEAIDPNFVQVLRRSDGVVGRKFMLAGTPIPEVPYSSELAVRGRQYLLHIPYVVTVESPEGTTPLLESTQVLRGLLETEQHTAELFANGTHVGGVLSTTNDITVAQAEQWQAMWITARKTGRIPVLGNGLAYRNENPNARDLQMVEARSFNQSVVWAMLGIPMAYMGSSLMGGQSSLSYANAQDNRRQFADNCLRAFTTQIEDAISRLLPPGRTPDEDQRAVFDYTEWEGRADGNPAPADQ